MDDEPGFDIGIVDRDPGSQPQAKQDRTAGLGRGLLAVAVAIAVLIAVPLLFFGSDDVEPEAAQEATDETEEPVDAPADGASVQDDLVGEADEGQPRIATSTDVEALFRGEINANGKRYGIAYVSNESFVVLDDRGITLPELEIAVSFRTVSNLALLTTDGRTWAVNTRDRTKNYLVSNSYIVVVSERPGTIAIIRPDNRESIGLMSSALPAPPVLLPDGAELLWVQGRGPLVLPRTGGTFEVLGIASSLTKVSDDRAVAASLHGTIYESCDDSLQCDFRVEVDDESPVALPFEPGTEFSLSPDGAWLVADDQQTMTLFDVTTSVEIVALEPDATAIAWAPDSRFVVIAAGNNLSVVFPETQQVLPLRLDLAPDFDSLLIFEG